MFMQKMTDLRFVIGLFLTLIGTLVLGSYFFGGDDLVQGVHLNLLGGGTILIVGLLLGGSTFVGEAPTHH
jgi:hypothetical protein